MRNTYIITKCEFFCPWERTDWMKYFVKYILYIYFIFYRHLKKYISSINRKYTIITCVLTIIWLWKTNSEAINHGGRVLISLLLVSVRRFMSENRKISRILKGMRNTYIITKCEFFCPWERTDWMKYL